MEDLQLIKNEGVSLKENFKNVHTHITRNAEKNLLTDTKVINL